MTEGDAIDISGVLEGFDAATDAITDFVQFTNAGANTTLSIDADGAGGYTAIATINGLNDLDADQLLSVGSLIA